MWVKTVGGSLLNIGYLEDVKVIADSADGYCVIGSVACVQEYTSSTIHRGDRESCQQVMDDIEHGLATGALLVDLLNRESHGHKAV